MKNLLRFGAFRGTANTFLLKVVIVTLLFLPEESRSQTNGALDPTFGAAGFVMTPMGSTHDFAEALAVQTDNKIVAAGLVGISSVPYNNLFGLARYMPNGSLDPSFGNNGIVTTNIGNGDDQARALVIQSDGRIIVAGSATNNGVWDLAMVRYLPNGDLDNSFGSNGKVVRDVAGGHDVGFAAALQPDGRILVAGSTIINGISNMVVVRYNTNGTPDNSFDQDGLLAINFGSDFASATCIAVHANKILLGGYATNGSSKDFAIVRLNANGTFDNTFGNGGGTLTTIGPGDDFARGIAIQLDGGIVMTGQSTIGATRQMALVRYLANGQIDLGFGSAGTGICTIHTNLDEDRVGGVLIQPDQKIVIAGSSNDGDTTRHVLVRYNTGGTMDASFGTNGIRLHTIGQAASYATAVTWDLNGRILTAGGAFNGTDADFLLTRHTTDNTVAISDFVAGEDPQVVVYPNPSNGAFTVQLPGSAGTTQIYATDCAGRSVYGPIVVSPGFIDLSIAKPPGLYYLHIQTQAGISLKAVMIQ